MAQDSFRSQEKDVTAPTDRRGLSPMSRGAREFLIIDRENVAARVVIRLADCQKRQQAPE